MRESCRALNWALMMMAYAAAALTVPALPAAGETLTGRLWIVDINTALSPFSRPTATPDATFTTDVPSFAAQGPTTNAGNIYVGYTVKGWLDSYHKVGNLKFSGIANPYLGAPVTASTLIGDGVGYGGSNGTYGTMIELKGKLVLNSQELLIITTGDGVNVLVDDASIVQHSGPGGVRDILFFDGSSGVHSVDMFFAECWGGGAEFFFEPLPNQKIKQ
jgi:hypothetical protein